MTIRIRKVTIERSGPDLLAMDEQGRIRVHPDSQSVTRWVRRRDADAKRRGRSTITVLEWRNMPPGFSPPS
jgi:hypothetical protein